jgi:hypothetical protein
MKWRKTVPLLFACLVFAMVAPADDSEKKIIGKWQTDIILSQLGRIVDWREFRADGTCSQKLDFLDADIPDNVADGTYKISGDKLTTVTQIKTHTSRFRFEGEHLIIDDGGKEVFGYTKVK